VQRGRGNSITHPRWFLVPQNRWHKPRDNLSRNHVRSAAARGASGIPGALTGLVTCVIGSVVRLPLVPDGARAAVGREERAGSLRSRVEPSTTPPRSQRVESAPRDQVQAECRRS
jgi:hypothetical protein